MTRPTKIILIVIAAVAFGWLGYTKVLKTLFLEPRAAALQNIARSKSILADYRKNQDDAPRVLNQLQKFTDRTLGGDLETVDANLRTRLSRLAESAKIDPNFIVNTTGGGKLKDSPAKSKFIGLANKPLREERDFHELEGWISGGGTFEQVMRLIDSIEAEPWIKRIDQLRLDPKDNGDRFTFNIRLTTLFLPKRMPNAERAPQPREVDLERYAALLQTNPFRVPPAQPKRNVEVAVATGPPAFPYEQWAVTGVAESLHGTEIWLLNRQTNESRRLVVGEKLEDVVLVAANGENAEFQKGGDRFIVAIGANLNDRSPLNQ